MTSRSFSSYLPSGAARSLERKGILSSTLRRTAALIEEKKPESAPIEEKIVVTPSSFSITDIDLRVRKMLLDRRRNLPFLRERLAIVREIAETTSLRSEKALAVRELSELRTKIRDLELGSELALYDLNTSSLTATARKLTSKVKPRSFLASSCSEEELASKRRLNELSVIFLRTVSTFVEVTNFSTRSRVLTCSGCGSTELSITEDSCYVCRKCGGLEEVFDEAPTFRDTDRVNMSTRYKYTRKNYFLTAIERFQGKQNTTIAPEVYEDLRNRMKDHRLTAETLTKDHVYMFLATKHSNHYDDINLIHHILTKKPLPDISIYESKLLSMLDLVEGVYEKVKDPSRVNSMNVNYKLYKILQLCGYPCRKDDFYILRSAGRMAEHDVIWSKICSELKWKVLATV